jgi:hypothetical protein
MPSSSQPPIPAAWRPLVSPAQWHTIVLLLGDDPVGLQELRELLEQPSPRVRRALLENLAGLASAQPRLPPQRVVFLACAQTGHELTMRSAEQRARRFAGLDHPGRDGSVLPLRPRDAE